MSIKDKTEADALRELFEMHTSKSQAEFGRDNGLGSPSMVHQYLNGIRNLGLLAGVKFAIGLGVDLRAFSPRLAKELEFVSQALPQADGEPAPEYVRIRCVKLLLETNREEFKIAPLEMAGAFIAFRHDWLTQHGLDSTRLLAVQANDEGMRPTLITGDMVVIDTTSRVPKDGSVFAINYEGELRIRRLMRDAATWWLYCDNAEAQRYPRKQLVEKHCYIIGKVVHRQSENI